MYITFLSFPSKNCFVIWVFTSCCLGFMFSTAAKDGKHALGPHSPADPSWFFGHSFKPCVKFTFLHFTCVAVITANMHMDYFHRAVGVNREYSRNTILTLKAAPLPWVITRYGTAFDLPVPSETSLAVLFIVSSATACDAL